jgi:hypothetical protein
MVVKRGRVTRIWRNYKARGCMVCIAQHMILMKDMKEK